MMKYLSLIVLLVALKSGYANHDTLTFWQFAADFTIDEKKDRVHDWGSETIQYLGTITWISPAGKELEIRIVTAYRRVTEANGFKDQSILALVKTNHHVIKLYDFVSRQNLPVAIRENKLVFQPGDSEIQGSLPSKFGERFCVEGLNCFAEAVLKE